MKQQLIMHQCAQAIFNADDAFAIGADTVPYAMFTQHDAWPWILQGHASGLHVGVACMQETMIPPSLRGHNARAPSAES